MESLVINRFEGGITDLYLSSENNCASTLDNYLLTDDGKPYVRPGTWVFPARIPQTLTHKKVTGIYLGQIPFDKPVGVVGDQAYFLSDSDSWTEIQGPGANVAIPNKDGTSLESTTLWRNQLIVASNPDTVLPTRIYCTAHSPTTLISQTLGLPSLASNPTLASAGGTGSNYIYAFHYDLQFSDYQSTEFEERGGIIEVSISNVGAVDSNNITISNIPVLANTSSTNYTVNTNLKIKIYRTQNNGTTFYFVATVNNGTTSYVDSTSDTTLTTQETIYTDGGVLQWDQPPSGAKYVVEVNDFFWYATDRSVTHSIQGAPGASPGSYEQPVAQKVIGLNSANAFPILFCDRGIYRIEGTFDEFGGGGFEPREISKTAGCVSNRSIVPVPGGLVWGGNGGFYFTDGSSVQKISKGLPTSYASWANTDMAGAYDSLRNIVFWTVADSETIVALHLHFGLRDSSTFTTLSAASNIFPYCLSYSESFDVASRFRSKLLIGDIQGYLFIQDDLYYTDPRIDTQSLPSSWTKKAIIHRYESIGFDFGDDSTRKFCTEITAELINDTQSSVQFLSRRDDGGAWGTFSEIRNDEAITWGLTEVAWDSSTLDTNEHYWDAIQLLDGKRSFPAGTLRSTRRQIGLTNSFTYVGRSDDSGTATTDTTAKTVTLNDSSKRWPEDCEDYYIYFGDDSYVNNYKIKTRTSDTVIIVYDPYSTLPSGSTHAWQMRGYRKQERSTLLSYTIWFDKEQSFTGSRGTSGLVNG